MTRDGWRDIVLNAVYRHECGKSDLLDLLSFLLTEQDAARQSLRELGFGCVGRPWPGIVEDIQAFMDGE